MKLQQKRSPPEQASAAEAEQSGTSIASRDAPDGHTDDEARAAPPTAIAAAVSAHVTAAAATMPNLPPASVKMAGYLDKRGKRLPTWKRYWFVLDGRLLLYFRSQFDYLQLSPCRGSLNLGLVSGVRPAGSRASPQLELVSRSQTVLLRAKERGAQERWLQALLDAMQLHTPSATGSQTHFRYSTASLPQASSKKNGAVPDTVEEEGVEEEIENEDGVATPRVLQRIKHIGNQSYGTLAAEIRSVGTGSLRHVATSSRSVPHTSNKVGEITAQLPTNKAVLRLLERRQQEEEDQQHVTTIVIDPAESECAQPMDNASDKSSNKTKATLGSSENSVATETAVNKSEVKGDIEIENDVYALAPANAVLQENEVEYSEYEAIPLSVATAQEGEDDMYEAVAPTDNVSYDTVGSKENANAVYEPSLPPRPVHEFKEFKEEDTKNKKQDKGSKTSFSPSSNSITRKRSFLQRMLGTNKNKKTVTVNVCAKNIPIIKIDDADEDVGKEDFDENAAYETVDYEELIKHRQEAEGKEQILLLNDSAMAELQKKVETIVATEQGQKNKEYVNVDAMMNTPAAVPVTQTKGASFKTAEYAVSSKSSQQTNSCIVPIVENEKTHTVTITVQDNRETVQSVASEKRTASSSAPEITVEEAPNKPELPPRQASSGSLVSPLPRPTSPWHDVPTNNAPVLAKCKRQSSELLCTALPVDLVAGLENEDSDIHKTIINIAENKNHKVQTFLQNGTHDTTSNETKTNSNENVMKEKIETETIPAVKYTTQSQELSSINKEHQKEVTESCGNCILRSQKLIMPDESQLIQQVFDNRCTHKHHSADELDILLRQLTQITNSPLHSASVDALEPLRKRRSGSDPDYDVPRPHHLYLSLMSSEATEPKKQADDIMEATRFFNEPDLYYARPLSEYLQELERMSNVQQKRTTRASKAFHKWLEDSQDIFPSTGNLYNDEVEEAKKFTTPTSATEEITEVGSCAIFNTEPEVDSNTKDIENVIRMTEQETNQLSKICNIVKKTQVISTVINYKVLDSDSKEKQHPSEDKKVENVSSDISINKEVKEILSEQKAVMLDNMPDNSIQEIEQISTNNTIVKKNIYDVERKQIHTELENCDLKIKECSDIIYPKEENCEESKVDGANEESSEHFKTETEELDVQSFTASEVLQTQSMVKKPEQQTSSEISDNSEPQELAAKVADLADSQSTAEEPEQQTSSELADNSEPQELAAKVADIADSQSTAEEPEQQTSSEIADNSEPQELAATVADIADSQSTAEEPEQQTSSEIPDNSETQELAVNVAEIVDYKEETTDTKELQTEQIKFDEKINNPNKATADTTDANSKVTFDIKEENPCESNAHKNKISSPNIFSHSLTVESTEIVNQEEKKEFNENCQVDESPGLLSVRVATNDAESDNEGVVMRNKKSTNGAVRLSFAMADTELVVEETVNLINTPLAPGTFAFAPE